MKILNLVDAYKCYSLSFWQGLLCPKVCFRLRNEFPSVFAIIVWPTMNFGDISGPVAVSRPDRRSPFQGVGLPGILGHHSSPFVNGVKEIKKEQELDREYDDGHDTDHPVKAVEFIKGYPIAIVHVPAGNAGEAFVVHRPEDEVGAGEGYPEVDMSEGTV